MRLQPLRQRSTPGRARHWNGERRQRPLTNFYDQPTNTLLRRPLESALAASIAVVHEPAAMDGAPIMEGLLQCIEHEARVCRAGDTPADDAAGVGIDDEGDIDKTTPGRHVCEVGDPEHIRTRRMELAGYGIPPGKRRLFADRRPPPLSPGHPLPGPGRPQPPP